MSEEKKLQKKRSKNCKVFENAQKCEKNVAYSAPYTYNQSPRLKKKPVPTPPSNGGSATTPPEPFCTTSDNGSIGQCTGVEVVAVQGRQGCHPWLPGAGRLRGGKPLGLGYRSTKPCMPMGPGKRPLAIPVTV